MFRRQVYNLHSFLGIDKYKKLIVVSRSHEREREREMVAQFHFTTLIVKLNTSSGGRRGKNFISL